MGELLDEEWLTVKAVARKLNVPPQEIYEVIKSGQLKAIRIGRTIRVPRRYLEEFVKRLDARESEAYGAAQADSCPD